jgi:2-polyprenyl-6-methoxyphenol hydroxylase-like FAD-dependent oxidoreductase
MARTLELLAPSGITQHLVAQGVRVSTFGIWSARQQVAQLDFALGIDGPYPYVLMVPQHTIEAILAEQVARQGGTVERGVELVAVTQRAEDIEVILRHADQTEERTCSSYLIGCDGAHSTVRHLIGAPFVGTAVAQQFLTGDVRMRWELPHDQALACFNRGQLIAFFPLPDGQHRFLSVSAVGETALGEDTFEEIQRVIDTCGPPGARATDPSWLARYQVHRRMVDCYVYQRVLLAGDAAHVHSPLGAQGMNAGMQDATNLAWKLALVMQGRAPARLLESYHVERAEVGAHLLQEDAVLTRLACLRHPLAIATRDRVAPCISRHPLMQQFINQTAAGLRVSYQHGPLALDYRGSKVACAASAVKVGGRAPNAPVVTSPQSTPTQLYDLLTGTGHALLLFTPRLDEEHRSKVQSALADWQDLLEIYTVRRCKPVEGGARTWHDPDGVLAGRYGIADEGLVLIRPDGYISFRSRSLAPEPLQRYLGAHFFARSPHE